MTTYVVLVERTVSTDVGDTVFALLGYYEADRPEAAAAKARAEYFDTPGPILNLVVIPAAWWRTR